MKLEKCKIDLQNKTCLNEYVDIFVHTLYYAYAHNLKFYVRFC